MGLALQAIARGHVALPSHRLLRAHRRKLSSSVARAASFACRKGQGGGRLDGACRKPRRPRFC